MSLKKKLLGFIALITLVVTLTPYLIWRSYNLYAEEKIRFALVEYMELPKTTSYGDAVDYFDCRYFYVGMSHSAFETKLNTIGRYYIIPYGSLPQDPSNFSIVFYDLNITRYYEINPEYLSSVSRPMYGDGNERVECPSQVIGEDQS